MKLKHPLPKKPSRVCGCRTCGEVFNSTYAFDNHRRGPYSNRRCLTVEEMTAKGWSQNPYGRWMTPGRGVGVWQGAQNGAIGAKGGQDRGRGKRA